LSQKAIAYSYTECPEYCDTTANLALPTPTEPAFSNHWGVSLTFLEICQRSFLESILIYTDYKIFTLSGRSDRVAAPR
jgi:hypothetical protein